MRNTYTLSRLEQRIRQALPRHLSPAGESAIAGFLSLAGISRWQPVRLGILELSFVFYIGLPLGLIGDNPTVKSIAARVGDSVCDGRYPDTDLWRVVHAAALLSHWDANVEFEGTRIIAKLPNGSVLGVDVGTAEALGRGDVDAPTLRMIDVCGESGGHGVIAAACAEAFATSRRIVGVMSFEPRFWVSVEQKEWIYRVRMNAQSEASIGTSPFDRPDSGRRVLRVALLESAASDR